MILSELFIIYLAAAAPFGVARFLSEHAGGAGTAPALLKAAGAALSWPFTSLPRLLRHASSRRGSKPANGEGAGTDGLCVETAKRAALGALREVEDILEDHGALKCETERHALFAARECVERYAGLALASAEARPEALPTAREMELCRIAGRGGDDLLVAGRCVHRRNVTRLVAHRERASTELVQGLAAVLDLARAACARDRAEHLGGGGVNMISETLPRALSRISELLSLFDDRATAFEVARLLDAESGDGAHGGEERCTTQAVPTAFATRPLRTTTSHGG